MPRTLLWPWQPLYYDPGNQALSFIIEEISLKCLQSVGGSLLHVGVLLPIVCEAFKGLDEISDWVRALSASMHLGL